MTNRAPSGSALRGRDGWLFLADDTNRIVEQYVGALTAPEDELHRWSQETNRRRAACIASGSRYVLLVAPDKMAVYADKLPPHVVAASTRPIDSLIARIAAADVLYPLAELRKASRLQSTYGQTDTHWTDAGALTAVRALTAALGRTDDPAQVYWRELRDTVRVGDLGEKLSPPRAGAWVESPAARPPDWSNGLDYTGRLACWTTRGSPGGGCVVFGNSFFSDVFASVLADMFGRVLFVFTDNVDHELVRRERPDLVLHQTCERFIIRAPQDRTKLSGRECGAVKWLVSFQHAEIDSARYAELREAARLGSEDCRVQLDAVNVLAGWNEQGKRAHVAEARFSLALAHALAGRAVVACEHIIEANSCFPDRHFLAKFVSFALEHNCLDVTRELSRQLRAMQAGPGISPRAAGEAVD
jgi:hypothetical protein